MKQLLLFGVLVFALSVSAQDTSFARIYEPLLGHLDYNMSATDADVVWDEGLITSGHLASNSTTFIARISAVGDLIWQKQYGTNWGTGELDLNEIISTKDSCFVAAGKVLDSSTGDYLPFCMKLDASGDTLWTKTFRLTNQMTGSYGSYSEKNGCVIETVDSMILIGFHHSSFEQTSTDPDHLFFSKLTSDGNLLWSESFMSDSLFYLTSLKQAADSSIYAVGNAGLTIDMGFVLNFSSNGQMNWGRLYNGARFADVEVDDNHLNLAWMNTNYEWGIAQLNLNGDHVRRVKNSVGIGAFDYYASICRRSNGNLGMAMVNQNDFGSIRVVEVMDNLDPVQQYDVNMNTSEVLAIPNKGMYAVGYGPLYGIKVGDYEMGVVRFDSLMTAPNCAYPVGTSLYLLDSLLSSSISFMSSDPVATFYTPSQYSGIDFVSEEGCVTFLGSVSEIEGSWNETVSPNPSTGSFTIDWNEYREADVKIYNSIGQEVYQSSVKDSWIDIQLKNEKEGMYFYQLIDSNGHKSTGKLVVTK